MSKRTSYPREDEMGCDIHIAVEVKDGGRWRMLDMPEIYNGRNYGLFAILAGVRNCHDIKPIDGPRGFPVDADCRTVAWHDMASDHSRSYLTLQELRDAPWHTQALKSGLVSKYQYDVFKSKGRPDSYCQGTNRREISNAEMDAYTPPPDEPALFGGPVTKIEWVETYGDMCNCFRTDAIAKLEKIAEKYAVSPDCVRIVVGFDG